MKIEQMQIDKLENGIELLKELIAEVKSLKEVVQGLQLSNGAIGNVQADVSSVSSSSVTDINTTSTPQ